MWGDKVQNKDELRHLDQEVGARLKARRKVLGWSLTKVADELGISYQQVQKYELGQNRIGASRLITFSKLYEVPITHFFLGLEEASKSETVELDPDHLETARIFNAIPCDETKRTLKSLMRALAEPALD